MRTACIFALLLTISSPALLTIGAAAVPSGFRQIIANTSASLLQSAPNTTTSFSYLPVFATVPQGQSIVSQLTLEDTSPLPEYVSLSVHGFAYMLSLSTTGLALEPGQNTSINLLLSSNQSSAPGTYYIPISITTTAGNFSRTETKYITFIIQERDPNTALVSSIIDLINNTQAATGTIEVKNPTGGTIGNLTFKTTVITPLSTVYNTSQIIVYGMDNNVSVENSSYVITWHISSIPAGGSAYGYYNINNLAFAQMTEVFTPLILRANNNLKITNIGVPPFYTNSTDRVQLFVSYTGTAAQYVTLTLTALPNNLTIYNSTQRTFAQPGQLLNASFYVVIGRNTGTLVLNLSARTNGSNVSYTLPVAVLQKPALSTNILQIGYLRGLNDVEYAAEAVIIAILTIVALLVAYLIELYLSRKR